VVCLAPPLSAFHDAAQTALSAYVSQDVSGLIWSYMFEPTLRERALERKHFLIETKNYTEDDAEKESLQLRSSTGDGYTYFRLVRPYLSGSELSYARFVIYPCCTSPHGHSSLVAVGQI
jgi:hypothetical protein